MARKKSIIFKSTFTEYEAFEIIAEGGSGRIYKAYTEDRRIVAIKLLDPQQTTKEKIKRFKNELTFGLRNRHPNIVTVLDHGLYDHQSGSSPFYVMPYYPQSLRSLIDAGIDSQNVIEYFNKLINGVEAAHLQQIVHRDLKPENILVDHENTELVIADFGIAHFYEEELFTSVETRPNTRLANFRYAAPEQRTPGQKVDQRADIFAIGLILNEMFTVAVPQGTGYKTIGENIPVSHILMA
jgi:serine/threonine protein kinase